MSRGKYGEPLIHSDDNDDDEDDHVDFSQDARIKNRRSPEKERRGATARPAVGEIGVCAMRESDLRLFRRADKYHLKTGFYVREFLILALHIHTYKHTVPLVSR